MYSTWLKRYMCVPTSVSDDAIQRLYDELNKEQKYEYA